MYIQFSPNEWLGNGKKQTNKQTKNNKSSTADALPDSLNNVKNMYH